MTSLKRKIDKNIETKMMKEVPLWDREIPSDVESLFGSYLGFNELERLGRPDPTVGMGPLYNRTVQFCGNSGPEMMHRCQRALIDPSKIYKWRTDENGKPTEDLQVHEEGYFQGTDIARDVYLEQCSSFCMSECAERLMSAFSEFNSLDFSILFHAEDVLSKEMKLTHLNFMVDNSKESKEEKDESPPSSRSRLSIIMGNLPRDVVDRLHTNYFPMFSRNSEFKDLNVLEMRD